MEILPVSDDSSDLQTIRRRLGDLSEFCRSCKNHDSSVYTSDSDKLIYECASQIQSRVDQIISDCSEIEALGDEDLESCFAQLQKELRMVEEEKIHVSNEIRILTGTYSEELNYLEDELERLTYLLDHMKTEDMEHRNGAGHHNPSEENPLNLRVPFDDAKFEMMELSDQIEKNNRMLQSLQDLDVLYRRFEAVENIEDTMTGVRVLGYENNCIRLAVRTYIPNLDGSFSELNVGDISDSFVLDHELSIKVIDGTLKPENLEIVPNDIHFGEILDAAKSVRHARPLEWLLRKVQDRIVICTLRRHIMKAANSSRYSFEYNDGDETIISHMVGEVDAFIKVPIGWPIIKSPLKLISLSSPDKKKISLTFLCKVQELSNSLDTLVRQNLQSFVEAVEEILVQQMHLEL